jgi:hypothetical protein
MYTTPWTDPSARQADLQVAFILSARHHLPPALPTLDIVRCCFTTTHDFFSYLLLDTRVSSILLPTLTTLLILFLYFVSSAVWCLVRERLRFRYSLS